VSLSPWVATYRLLPSSEKKMQWSYLRIGVLVGCAILITLALLPVFGVELLPFHKQT
jgi:hypothetical protein